MAPYATIWHRDQTENGCLIVCPGAANVNIRETPRHMEFAEKNSRRISWKFFLTVSLPFTI